MNPGAQMTTNGGNIPKAGVILSGGNVAGQDVRARRQSKKANSTKPSTSR